MRLRPALLSLLLAAFASGGVVAQPEPVTVVVLGSSNAEGYGPAHADSAWAVRLDRALAAHVPGSRVVNLAKGGYTTSHLLPTGTAVPEGRPAPDPERNVTAALAARPDAVVISLTSNDSAREVPVEVQLAAYDAMLDGLGDVPVFVTTTTPRTGGISALGQRLQAAVRDSTLARYGARASTSGAPSPARAGRRRPGSAPATASTSRTAPTACSPTSSPARSSPPSRPPRPSGTPWRGGPPAGSAPPTSRRPTRRTCGRPTARP